MPAPRPRSSSRAGRRPVADRCSGDSVHDRAVAVAVARHPLGASLVTCPAASRVLRPAARPVTGRSAIAVGGVIAAGGEPRARRRRRSAPARRPPATISSDGVEFGDPTPTAEPRRRLRRRGLGDGAAASDRSTSRARSSTTARCYKPVAVDTSVRRRPRMLQHYKVKNGRHADGHRQPVRRLDDDGLVGEQAQVQGLAQGRQDLIIPPVNGLIVTVKAGDTLESLAGEVQDQQRRDRRGQRARGPEPHRRPGARPPGRQGQGHPEADAEADARRPAVAGRRRWRQRRGGPVTYSGGALAWPVVGGGNYISQYSTTATTALDIAADYGTRRSCRGRRDGDLRRLEEQRRRLPGLDLPRHRPLHDATTTCPRSPSAAARTSAAASASAGSARPAGPPARTSTSRSGAAQSGRAADGSTRWVL